MKASPPNFSGLQWVGIFAAALVGAIAVVLANRGQAFVFGLFVNSDTIGAAFGAALTIIGAQTISGISTKRAERLYRSNAIESLDLIDKDLTSICEIEGYEIPDLVTRIKATIEHVGFMAYTIPESNIAARIKYRQFEEAAEKVWGRLNEVLTPQILLFKGAPEVTPDIELAVGPLRLTIAELRKVL